MKIMMNGFKDLFPGNNWRYYKIKLVSAGNGMYLKFFVQMIYAINTKHGIVPLCDDCESIKV